VKFIVKRNEMVGICVYHKGYFVVDWRQWTVVVGIGRIYDVWHKCVGDNSLRGCQ
jgi:hypothetical protein